MQSSHPRSPVDRRRSTVVAVALALLVGVSASAQTADDDAFYTGILPGLDLGLGVPELDLRGFADVGLRGDLVDPDSGSDDLDNQFVLGDIDLFVTSQIARDVSTLSEIILHFEDSSSKVSVERLLLKYDHRDWLQINGGRGHTSFGFWFQEYHHGTWLYTTIKRPAIYKIGGFLPVHFVGVEFMGNIPVGPGLLSYTLTVSNGRAISPSATQNIRDQNDSKAITGFVRYEPESAPGLRFGASAHHDWIPDDSASGRDGTTREQIYGLHVVYERRAWEFFAEAFWIRHDDRARRRTDENVGAYAQLAYRIDRWKPYYRFDWFAIDSEDPYFAIRADIEDRKEHTVGVRWDARRFMALKFEYRNLDTERMTAHEGAIQASFAF